MASSEIYIGRQNDFISECPECGSKLEAIGYPLFIKNWWCRKCGNSFRGFDTDPWVFHVIMERPSGRKKFKRGKRGKQ